MKILRSVFLILLILISAALLVLQSDWGKRLSLRLLTESLQQAGWTIKTGKIEGNLPHTLIVHHLEASSAAFSLRVERLETRLALAALLKKELLFTELQAQGVSWQSSGAKPFSETKALSAIPRRGVAIRVKQFHLSDLALPLFPHADVEGSGVLDGAGKFSVRATIKSPEMSGAVVRITAQADDKGSIRSKGSLILPQLFPWEKSAVFQFSFKGKTDFSAKLWGNVYLADMGGEKISLQADMQINPSWQVVQSKIAIAASDFRMQFTSQQEKVHLNALIHGLSWEGNFRYALAEKKKSLLLSDIAIQGADTALSGALELFPSFRAAGRIHMTASDLHKLSDFFGKAEATIVLQPGEERQELQGEGVFENVHWGSFFVQQGRFQGSLDHGELILENGHYDGVHFSTLAFRSSFGSREGPFSLTADGHWKQPFHFRCEGTAALQGRGISGALSRAEGMLGSRPLSLSAPSHFFFSSRDMQLRNFDIFLGGAHLFFDGEKAGDTLRLKASLEKIPLEIIPLPVDLGGQADISLALEEKGGETSGAFAGSISSSAENSALVTGSFQGTFAHERVDARGSWRIGGAEVFSFDCALPIRLDLMQREGVLLYEKPARASISLRGKIEDILDFFNLGTHRITGSAFADFHLADTLSQPHIEGDFRLERGSYENYLTGTRLYDLNAKGVADGSRLLIQSVSARGESGFIGAQGAISFDLSQRFPFSLDIEAHRFRAAHIDLISAEVEGKMHIEGNLQGAKASGQIEVVRGEIHIPDRLPRLLPRLAVVYKNPTKPIEPPEASGRVPYPLSLDLRVAAPASMTIEGRGLKSEWLGDFRVGGTLADVVAEGGLKLARGEFSFAGREFKLLDGKLSFSGKEHEMPRLDLSGVMEIKGISIQARLKGPLNHPQLTLHSSPPLPLGAIMSYLLFGQDLAEINSFQALQLANSIASFAGQGPDVLESTRKALGVDKLNIVSMPGKNEEMGDIIAVQVGKYISEGVLVSLTQGAEESSTNISIEVELNGGWIVQLESDQRQEQGKFTIKWSHNF